ncbi:MAG: hypothetical protein K2Y21_01910 [Phycisphaerales bacterium]|nr:hypothetical protein [Phycisphaerales bacterium]
MSWFNTRERKAICLIAIVAGILITVVSAGFMALAAALEGLSGMGNPSPESLRLARESADRTHLILLLFIGAGLALVFLGFMCLPRASDKPSRINSRPYLNPTKPGQPKDHR